MSFRWGMFREAAALWSKHNAPRLGASLAFYAVLSLAPLLIISVALCGLLFGGDSVRGQVYGQIRGEVGTQAASVVETLLKSAHNQSEGIVAGIVGFVVLLFGASGVFMELRDTLNFIWDAPPSPSTGVWGFVRYRLACFAMVVGIGFLLMASLALTAFIQFASHFALRQLVMPAPVLPPFMLEVINFALTFIATTLFFAFIYRFIPEVPIEWADVGEGSLVTAALFTTGKLLIGVYLGRASVGSPYGAAGSLMVLLVWVYYSAQIFLYGAEFTWVQARERGSLATQRAMQDRVA
jgi:membrane protein